MSEANAYDAFSRSWPGHTLRLFMPHRRGIPDLHWQVGEHAGFLEVKLRKTNKKLAHKLTGNQLKFLRKYQSTGGLCGVLVYRQVTDTTFLWELYCDLQQFKIAPTINLDPSSDTYLSLPPDIGNYTTKVVSYMKIHANLPTLTA